VTLGGRQLVGIGSVPLERADPIPDVTTAYETWGTLSPTRDNAVLVLHALTGDPTWWVRAVRVTRPRVGGTA
jgi:homoserine O-acetyltransferase